MPVIELEALGLPPRDWLLSVAASPASYDQNCLGWCTDFCWSAANDRRLFSVLVWIFLISVASYFWI